MRSVGGADGAHVVAVNHLAAQIDHRHAPATQRLVLGAASRIVLDIHFAIGNAILGKQLAGLGAVTAPFCRLEHDLAAGIAGLWRV